MDKEEAKELEGQIKKRQAENNAVLAKFDAAIEREKARLPELETGWEVERKPHSEALAEVDAHYRAEYREISKKIDELNCLRIDALQAQVKENNKELLALVLKVLTEK